MKVRAKDPSILSQTKIRVNGMVRLEGVWSPLRDLGIESLNEISHAVLERVMTAKRFPPTLSSRRLFYYDLGEVGKKAVHHYMAVHGVVEPTPALRLITGTVSTVELTDYIGEIAKKQGYSGWEEYHMWYLENVLVKDQGRGVPEGSKEVWPIILSEFADEGLQDGQHRFHQYVEYGLEVIPFVAFYDEVALIYKHYQDWRNEIKENSSK